MLETLFGNETAEKCLLYLANYGEGYPRAIAETFGVAYSQVYKQLVRLEEGGILVRREVGRSRIFTFNPRWPFREALLQLLEKALLLQSEADTQKYFRQRRRPRRTGKRL